MKYIFSSNDQNYDKTPFHHFGEKNLDGTNACIFGIIPLNTCNFIMQNISSI